MQPSAMTALVAASLQRPRLRHFKAYLGMDSGQRRQCIDQSLIDIYFVMKCKPKVCAVSYFPANPQHFVLLMRTIQRQQLVDETSCNITSYRSQTNVDLPESSIGVEFLGPFGSV